MIANQYLILCMLAGVMILHLSLTIAMSYSQSCHMTSLLPSNQQLLVPAQRTVFNLLRVKSVKIISVLVNKLLFSFHTFLDSHDSFK